MGKSIKLKNDTYWNISSILKVFYEYQLSSSQTKTTNDYEIITFDNLICGSKGNRHALSRNNGRFTINDTGTYRIIFNGYINPKTNNGQRALAIYKNGNNQTEIIRADIPSEQRTPFSFTYINKYKQGDIIDIRFRGITGDDIWSQSTLIIEQIE